MSASIKATGMPGNALVMASDSFCLSHMMTTKWIDQHTLSYIETISWNSIVVSMHTTIPAWMEHIIVLSASNVSQPSWRRLINTRLCNTTLHLRSKRSNLMPTQVELRFRSDTPILMLTTRSTMKRRSWFFQTRGTTY